MTRASGIPATQVTTPAKIIAGRHPDVTIIQARIGTKTPPMPIPDVAMPMTRPLLFMNQLARTASSGWLNPRALPSANKNTKTINKYIIYVKTNEV